MADRPHGKTVSAWLTGDVHKQFAELANRKRMSKAARIARLIKQDIANNAELLREKEKEQA